MAANKIERFGPAAMPTAVTDYVKPAAAGASGTGYTPTASYIILRHVRVVNKTAAACTVTFYLGASGGTTAGTEIWGGLISVAANSFFEVYPLMRMASTEVVTATCQTVTTLVFEAEGEVGLA
jgi:hypothetical protein